MPEAAAPDRHHVVIIGGGFGGLAAARALRKAPVRITLIDRTNHHLFQPLLYQVATAGLSPADVAAPIRHILRRQANLEVQLAEAGAIDLDQRRVTCDRGVLEYDSLVLAAGARTSYFGADHWEPHAPGLKSAADALAIRERFLLAFERAESEPDAERRRALLTFVVVGGGPTGVEMAGAMAEIARHAVRKDFRNIDTATARVILIEAGGALLPAFPPRLAERARDDLERLGVQVWLNTRVTDIDATGVTIGQERIASHDVIWAAGVGGVPLARTLGVDLTRAGLVRVDPDCSIGGHGEAFVIGDLASLDDPRTGAPIPGVAPAATQMGRFVGRLIARRAAGDAEASATFRYVDKGTLATIGRARAVATIKGAEVTGFLAWILWLAVHILFLIGFRNRMIVLFQWGWAYLTFQRGARLITRVPSQPESSDSP